MGWEVHILWKQEGDEQGERKGLIELVDFDDVLVQLAMAGWELKG